MQEKQRAFLVRTAYGGRRCCGWGYGICCGGCCRNILALGLAALVEPVIAWCRRRMGLKRGFTAAVVTIAVTAAILALAAVIVWQLIRQAAELLTRLPTPAGRAAGNDRRPAAAAGRTSVPPAPRDCGAGWRRSPPCWGPRRRCWRSGPAGRALQRRGPWRRLCPGCSCSAAPRPWRCFHHRQLSPDHGLLPSPAGDAAGQGPGCQGESPVHLGEMVPGPGHSAGACDREASSVVRDGSCRTGPLGWPGFLAGTSGTYLRKKWLQALVLCACSYAFVVFLHPQRLEQGIRVVLAGMGGGAGTGPRSKNPP